MRKLPIYLGLLVGLIIVVELLWHMPVQQGGEAPAVTTRVVAVDALSGDPVAAGTVTRLLDDGEPVGEALPLREGAVELGVGSPRLLRIDAPGYHPRVLAVGPVEPVTVPLTPSAPDSLTLRVAGQVVIGGRYYLPRADGSVAPLTGPEDVLGHRQLLANVAPLLADADLTLAGIGAPLVADPDPDVTPPVGSQPGTPAVLSQSTAVAAALAEAGVDVVGLADEHVMDSSEAGLTSTLEAIDAAGLARFGAGADLDAAWAPAYVVAGGRSVAFLGCTTLALPGQLGSSAAGPDTPGVASCEGPRLQAEVAGAAARADAVVVVIDGAARLGGEPADARLRAGVRRLAGLAAEAGATVVAGGFPQDPQEILGIDGVPWIQGTGSLVTDEEQWSAVRSSVTRIGLRAGRAQSVTVDALAMVADRPVPVAGTLAASVARQMRGTAAGLTTLGEGTTYWPPVGVRRLESRTGPPGSLVPVGNAWTIAELDSGARAGRDLLWGTGSFEDLDTDSDAGGSTLWSLGRYVTTSLEAGCSGAQGLRLRRGPLSAKDVVISPQYRQPVTAGSTITLTAHVRLASEGASLEVRWYRSLDPAKRSSGAESVAIEPHRLSAPCSPVRLDLVVPEGMVAAQPYVRLSPRHEVNLAAELRVDDVALIGWSSPAPANRQLDTLEMGATPVPVTRTTP